MKPQTLVKALEDVAQQMGVRVRRERGSFRGGSCTVADHPVIVLNKLHPPEAHLGILAEALRSLPVESIYIRPAVRRALEDLWTRRDELQIETEVVADDA